MEKEYGEEGIIWLIVMREIIVKILRMDLEYLIGQMVIDMKENLRMMLDGDLE